MGKIKILQLNSELNGGGIDNQTLELTAGLRDLGEDVTLAFSHGNSWGDKGRALGVPLEIFQDKGWLKLKMIAQLARFIRKHRIDIIQAHQGRDYWPAILAARLSGRWTRAVVSRHLVTQPRNFSRLFLLTMSDVVAVSRAVERVLDANLKGTRTHLHQIYGGIDTARFETERSEATWAFRKQYGWGADDIVFGVVGAYDFPRGKGQLDFLAAAVRLQPQFPRARFVIIGRGTMEAHLREQFVALGLEKVACLIQFTEKIPTALSALDVLVHPAVGSEALGLVVWEAMASGKPVIGSRLDGIAEAFVDGEHGIHIQPGNVEQLTEAMRVMLTNPPEQRARFGTAGREHVCRNFSRIKQAERMMALYREILSR